MITALFVFIVSSAQAVTPAAPSSSAQPNAEQAAAEAMATATDMIAEGNRGVSLPQATFESCMNGLRQFESEVGLPRENSITLRHHKVTWDGERILDLKTGAILWSHATDQLRLDGPDRRPEVAEGKKAMLVAEFEKARRYSVDRSTNPIAVRAFHTSLQSCRNVKLETFGMSPISKIASERIREVERMFPRQFTTSGATSRSARGAGSN